MWDSKRVQIMGASNHTEQESWESLNSWKKEKKKEKSCFLGIPWLKK